ncbi:MAG TPA: hypothetical protein DEQ47_16535 [Solibacterales bacterium]|nr:hypothetical protein [Bryobacterales bacterium]
MTRLAAALIFSLYAAAQPPPTLPTQLEIDAALHDLAAASGFRIKHNVGFRLITRAEAGRYFAERIQQSLRPKQVRAEELTLKKFGFVPADFDLARETASLMTEQATAFYDYRTRQLYIADWTPPALRETALLHELAHALADQNFSIGHYLGSAQKDSEAASAREAVVEGQATLLAAQVEFKRHGKVEDNTTDDAAPSGATEYPEFDRAPLYFRETLLFPYLQGSQFMRQVLAREGRSAFRDVFEQPPQTTRQILQVQAYFDHERPADPPLPSAPHGGGKHKDVVQGTLGELEHKILLQQFDSAETADALSGAWRGCRFKLLESDGRTMLLYASEWASDTDAAHFFDAYEKVLRGKSKSLRLDARTATRISGLADDGYFEVERNGARVTSRQGWPAAF